MTKKELKEINKIYKKLLGYHPKKTRLILNNKLNIYIPKYQLSYITNKSKLNLFHEYYGHGLFCERSLLGKKLIYNERNNIKDNFNLLKFEMFAIWSEYFLSKKLNLLNEFEKKYKNNKELVEVILDFNNRNGDLATFYCFGLERKTNIKRAKILLEDIYKNKIKDIKFATLYGSKKRFSDIDIFCVGNSPKEIHFDFLDVKMYSLKELNKGIKYLDWMFVTPILDGEFIIGDKNYFNYIKQQINNKEVNKEVRMYNLKKAMKMKKFKGEKFREYYNSYLHFFNTGERRLLKKNEN